MLKQQQKLVNALIENEKRTEQNLRVVEKILSTSFSGSHH